MSIYALKPRLQALLRPGVRALHDAGVTANQVTVAACVISVVLGIALYRLALPPVAFLAIPVWMFVRMGFNAIDGMLAREFGHESNLGAFLNELCDVLSDAAMYLPFAARHPFDPFWIGAIILLSAASELAGVLGTSIGASRRYDGPLGKSDRAFVFSVLGLWAGLAQPPDWARFILPALAAGITATMVRRVRAALDEVAATTR